jgi:ubiquitin-like 1-activating enzyme E1 B
LFAPRCRNLPFGAHQIDLDTIDTSNLNRQFLFRKKHVGQSKASVAAQSVRSFCPDAMIEAFCDNVKSPQ